MKKILKAIGLILALLIIVGAIFYVANNESLPTGIKSEKAEALATKMMKALNYEAYKNTEVLEWRFRGKHFYKWYKSENIVEVSWDKNKVILHTKQPEKSVVFVSDINTENQQLIQQATNYFNNDSFWLVAPFKVFDTGVERSIVKHNEKDALLITYTSGGSTPGDSYLWILNEEGFPTSFKMWTSSIPIGGIEASWSDWKTTAAGFQLPIKHKMSLFGVELKMGDVKASNPKADALAHKILKTIKHEAYKKTRYIEWSFRGKRFFKWDKQKHIVEVSWDNNKVILHTNNIEKSTVFIDEKESTENKNEIVKKAEAIFNNDNFWLVAPHKLFENGIIRNIVNIDGKEALKVKYTTGGSTPGDSYIWIVNDAFLPIQFLMTVPSMKMDQVPATWDDWFTTESGTLLPKNHTFSSGGKLSMGDVKAFN
ncbi:hypothetical protein KCTC32516_01670 [Polaribacter huanghezhanensis]|uniref:hypothetical protein n=1 Tax=Polaribacter huanghezhanensis TaxID=1354726 RepID=UPI002649B42C|nr:hypothetical protein [Polaribacter huanghezhanensis]WKD86300.1 hypothetical protein KCTC32516_01670 [Polaribacter huanghezhanensis]